MLIKFSKIFCLKQDKIHDTYKYLIIYIRIYLQLYAFLYICFILNKKTKQFKRVNKSVLSHITFYLEDDGHKPVIFHNEGISFTFQPIKI